MGSLEAEIDASFYNLVHQLSVMGGNSPVDRRRQRRSRFVATQRIALRRAPGIPDEAEFIEVQCHDLTRGGFSFLLPSKPSFHFLVVAFGAAPNITYISARVTHSEPVLVHKSGLIERLGENGEPSEANPALTKRMVLVGCGFIERLTPSRQLMTVVE
ncbi:MAG: hypothetical protein U1E05_14130 [Patescibacteria group bacterium]|nr:hypothetical protein [Patescibacteria group bacterium]